MTTQKLSGYRDPRVVGTGRRPAKNITRDRDDDNDEKRWMTLREAAVYARCSVKTLRRRIASADLPAYVFGRELRVLQHDVDHLMRRIMTSP